MENVSEDLKQQTFVNKRILSTENGQVIFKIFAKY